MAKVQGRAERVPCASTKCDCITLALGVVLMAAPWALGYAAYIPAMISSVVAGLAISLCSVLALVGLPRPFEEAGAACGVLAAAAPSFVGFRYVHDATTAHAVIGMAVAVVSLGGLLWARSRSDAQAKRA